RLHAGLRSTRGERVHRLDDLTHPDSDRVAFVFEGVSRTHAELHSRVARVAGALAARGVTRGDRVALLLHHGLPFPETMLARHRLGAIAVPINFRLAQSEIDYIVRDSGAVLLVDGPLDGDPVEQREASEAALICYTSGTTGRPKGAVLTHANLLASTRSWIH